MHQAKDCELDHAYILAQLEQLEIDPTLCSKYSKANKSFTSSETLCKSLIKNYVPGRNKTIIIPQWTFDHMQVQETLLSHE